MNFIQQAYKGKNDVWRYVISFLVIIIGWQFIGVIPLLAVAMANINDLGELMSASKDAFTSIGIDSNLYLLVMILTFLFGLISLLFVIKYIHLREIKTLFTSRNNIDWKRVFYGFTLWFSISLIMLTLDYSLNAENYVWNFQPMPFLILVLISFLFMPFQTSFEELLFRGYIMQGLGVLFKNAAVPLIVTSVVFGLLHGFNPEFDKLGPMIMIYYIGTGFLFGITTLMDDGTELSLGMHAANNIAAAVFVTMNWTVFQTEALFIDTSEPEVGIELFLPVFVIYPLVLFIFSKKYGWKNWNQKLFGKVEKLS
ncbi:MAG: CPBP family intramembrane metalloprotease, partial [Flavobacteriaceae bacterium]|nr:CPBP family intramembrane metalloprotease [Flavobacteriaceae bacterium]